MATSIRHHFPDRDGWRMNVNAPLGDKWGGIDVFKKTWEAPDGKKGLISFSIEGEDTSFDNLAFGIVKGLEKLELSEDQLLRIKQAATEVCGNGKTSQPWWPYYRYAENEYRYTGAAGKHLVSEEKLDRMCRYFVDVMLKMKEMAPVIDKIVAEFKIQK